MPYYSHIIFIYIYRLYPSRYVSPQYHTRSSSNILHHAGWVHCCCLQVRPPVLPICHLPVLSPHFVHRRLGRLAPEHQGTAQLRIHQACLKPRDRVPCSLRNQPFCANQSLWAKGHDGGGRDNGPQRGAVKRARHDKAQDPRLSQPVNQQPHRKTMKLRGAMRTLTTTTC